MLLQRQVTARAFDAHAVSDEPSHVQLSNRLFSGLFHKKTSERESTEIAIRLPLGAWLPSADHMSRPHALTRQLLFSKLDLGRQLLSWGHFFLVSELLLPLPTLPPLLLPPAWIS